MEKETLKKELELKFKPVNETFNIDDTDYKEVIKLNDDNVEITCTSKIDEKYTQTRTLSYDVANAIIVEDVIFLIKESLNIARILKI